MYVLCCSGVFILGEAKRHSRAHTCLERETERDGWRKITIEWRIKTERNDSQKINVLQYRHASACQPIPLWLILGGLFLAVRNLEALTRLLLHSSARNKALVCSNWLWIISYWLEFNKINEHNKEVLYVCTSKSLTDAQYKKEKKKRQDGKIAIVSGKTTKRKSDCHVKVFFDFKISTSVILHSLMSVGAEYCRPEVLPFSTMDSSLSHRL